MTGTITIIVSNLFIATLIAAFAILLNRSGRHSVFVHALWVIALVKLITPPIVALPLIPVDQFVQVAPQEDPNSHERPQFKLRQPCSSLADQMPTDRNQDRFFTDSGLSEKNKSLDKFDEFDASDNPSPFPESYLDSNPEPVLVIGGWESPVPGKSTVVTGQQFFAGLFCLWMLGSLIWLARVYSGSRRMRRLLQLVNTREKSVERKVYFQVNRLSVLMGLAQPPRVLITRCTVVPMVWASFGQGTLVLPGDLLNKMKSHQIEALIAHELAHLRCHHHWIRLLEIVVMAFYWWCPLVWLARRKLRESEEEICDAWVTHIMPEHTEDYANALVDTLAFLNSKKPSLPLGAMGINQFQLLNRRITMIMQDDRKPGLSLAGWLALIAMLLLGLPFSATAALNNSEAAPGVSRAETPSQLNDDDEEDERDDEDERDEEDELEDEPDEEANEWVDRDDFNVEEMVDELLEELKEELEEMDLEIIEEIEDIREEMREGFGEAPAAVRRVIGQLDINRMIRKSLRQAPQSAQMFVREVDPAHIIKELTEDADWDDEDIDDDEVDDVRGEVENRIARSLGNLVDRVDRQIDQARNQVERGLRELPEVAIRQLAQKNVVGVIEELAGDASPITQQFIEDAGIKDQIRRALQQKRRSSIERAIRDRKPDRRAEQRIREREFQTDRDRKADRDRRDALDRDDRKKNTWKKDDRRRNDWTEDEDHLRHELENRIEQMMDELNQLKRELRELDRRDRLPERAGR